MVSYPKESLEEFAVPLPEALSLPIEAGATKLDSGLAANGDLDQMLPAEHGADCNFGKLSGKSQRVETSENLASVSTRCPTLQQSYNKSPALLMSQNSSVSFLDGDPDALFSDDDSREELLLEVSHDFDMSTGDWQQPKARLSAKEDNFLLGLEHMGNHHRSDLEVGRLAFALKNDLAFDELSLDFQEDIDSVSKSRGPDGWDLEEVVQVNRFCVSQRKGSFLDGDMPCDKDASSFAGRGVSNQLVEDQILMAPVDEMLMGRYRSLLRKPGNSKADFAHPLRPSSRASNQDGPSMVRTISKDSSTLAESNGNMAGPVAVALRTLRGLKAV